MYNNTCIDRIPLSTVVWERIKRIESRKRTPTYGTSDRTIRGHWMFLDKKTDLLYQKANTYESIDDQLEIIADLFSHDSIAEHLMDTVIEKMADAGYDNSSVEVIICTEDEFRQVCFHDPDAPRIIDRALNHVLTAKDTHYYENSKKAIFMRNCNDDENVKKLLVADQHSDFICVVANSATNNSIIRVYVLDLSL